MDETAYMIARASRGAPSIFLSFKDGALAPAVWARDQSRALGKAPPRAEGARAGAQRWPGARSGPSRMAR